MVGKIICVCVGDKKTTIIGKGSRSKLVANVVIIGAH